MAGVSGRSGGARAGSGRKSDGEILRFRGLIDQAVTETDWLEIVRAAMKEAKGEGKGANLARVWLASYRFGVPTQPVDVAGEVTAISVIEYVSDNLSVGRDNLGVSGNDASNSETSGVDGGETAEGGSARRTDARKKQSSAVRRGARGHTVR